MSDYFGQLNYTLSNEDTGLELELLPEGTGHVFTIAGSGSRVLPLLAKNPQRLSIVDYSFEQIALTTLRLETLRALTHQQFLAFWGYPCEQEMDHNHRLDLLPEFKLSTPQREFLQKMLQECDRPIYAGRYEKMLKVFSKVIRHTLGKHIDRLRSFETHQEFISYLYKDFPHLRWKLLVRLLGNSAAMNALLYKGHHPVKNINLSFAEYFDQVFNALFRFLTPRQSFFLQMLFFGEVVDLAGAPVEADPVVFEKAKEGLKNCQINFYQGDFFGVLLGLDQKVDFVSFSDILSYFPAELGEVYLQKIRSRLNPGALTVHRYYLHVTQNMDTSGYEKITEQYLPLIHRETTQIYLVDVFRYNSR